MSESIYEWIRPAPVVPEKPPMYHSKHPADAPLVGSTIRVTKAKHAHMGAELKATITPQEFLKSHSNPRHIHIDPHSIPAKHHSATNSKMVPVPRRDERPVQGFGSGRDFIVENAVNAILTEPKTKRAQAMDWTKKKEYGKVPGYLSRVKQDIEAERDYILHMLDQEQLEAEAAGGNSRELNDDERAELLEALKRKWDEVNARYQVIAHRKITTSNSTVGEIRWKESCESQMSQLEADIKKLSVKAPIYIVEH